MNAKGAPHTEPARDLKSSVFTGYEFENCDSKTSSNTLQDLNCLQQPSQLYFFETITNIKYISMNLEYILIISGLYVVTDFQCTVHNWGNDTFHSHSSSDTNSHRRTAMKFSIIKDNQAFD